MNILHITSSVRGDDSESTRVTKLIVDKLVSSNPEAQVVRRDFGAQPHPLLDGAAVGALFTPVDQRNAEQAARVALDDALILEAQAADVIVIGAPMYNFGMPVQLKNWFDAIARSGVTFRYTETGPEGLLKNKKVYVATARGGVYPVEADPQVPHIRMLLNFLGMSDHTFIYSSGLNMGPDAAANGQQAANEAVEAALA
ncbi:FMN-dependent NADH-azoreductase [Massilia yuzhufengensis]|uniref:FMN dependent NADH:quinone oxidoreductase n=1 Tax=Massilia yuzhufengensis TaxID=1164594 RepID=A0A1I1PSX3_9BURK|nr:NAD(P)H-dependent oxidoreductase [Massilia yuzhufengensis]SFD10708.1 FMN-dependent NADH-azoreductase [Massilia yuzhufengensis]